MGLLLMKFMYCRIVSALILYGIWLSPPHGYVFHALVDEDGCNVVLLLKDFRCLGGEGCGDVGARMVWTDVNVSVSGIICCF